jgi:FkbM family methyltransferase
MSRIQQFRTVPEYRGSKWVAWRRLKRQFKTAPATEILDETAWGMKILCVPADPLDSHIWYRGMIDLEVAECLSRLVRPVTTVADVGANIGFMAGVVAEKLGANGEVIAFEPNPQVTPRLNRNVELWRKRPGAPKITVVENAVSDAPGEVTMHLVNAEGTNTAAGPLPLRAAFSRLSTASPSKRSPLTAIALTVPSTS